MRDMIPKIYKILDIPVLIVSNDVKPIFANDSFTSMFGKLKNLKHFVHKFNFDICVLDNDALPNYNPIIEAIKSNCDYSVELSYQNEKNNIIFFELLAIKEENKTALIFTPKENITKCEKLEKDYKKLESEYQKSLEINSQVARLEQTAREQAVNMSLINKISHQIRHSINSDIIIKTALKELLEIIGGFKGYWVIPYGENFVIKQIYPKEDINEENKEVILGKEATNMVYSHKIDVSTCLKEYQNSTSNYKKGIHRILVPVYSSKDFFGVIILLTKQKSSLNSITNILYALSTQIATEIAQASLFKQLNDKNDALEKTLTELKETQLQLINSEKMASLGHLIAGVAHEINTPIGSINANNTIIKKLIEKFTSQIKPPHKKYLDMLVDINKIDAEAINRISKMVTSLKKFVRLDEADLQEADINNELDLTLNLIHHEIKNKVEIIKEYSKLPPIKCYPNMLNQVFMNILVNACQSIDKKGKIFIKTAFENNELVVSIRDTGCGMSEEVKKNIFTPGFTTKGVGVGTGIGLAITYKIVEKHKGKITVNSKENEGSEFIISIPSM